MTSPQTLEQADAAAVDAATSLAERRIADHLRTLAGFIAERAQGPYEHIVTEKALSDLTDTLLRYAAGECYMAVRPMLRTDQAQTLVDRVTRRAQALIDRFARSRAR
jgi:hypothetical protein